MRRWLVLLAFAVSVALACDDDDNPCDPCNPPPVDTTIVEYTYDVVNTYPHDIEAFTEGLVWDDSVLLEGTGYFDGPSTLRRVDLETGVVIEFREAAKLPVAPFVVFGEGIARVDTRIIQLTWTERVAWVYDAATLDSIGEYHYTAEGWGLTHDGNRFIMSDGSARLTFRDLQTFDVIDSVIVRDENGPVIYLNELEYIDGRVWANVFLSPLIVMIDPATGRVRGRLDLSGIISFPPDVANGIAYDAVRDRLFVTGKRWSSLFEILTVEVPPAQ